MRRFLFMLMAVVAFFAAVLVAVVLLEGRPQEPRQEAAPPSPPPSPPPAVASPAAPLPAVERVPGDVQAPPAVRPPRPVSLARPPAVVPQVGEWERIPPVPAESWPSLTLAIEQARPTLAPCYDPEVQAQYGQRPYTALGAPRPAAGVPVVVVQLEAVAGGRARVVDAPVESRGAAEDGLLACFQERVRGLEVQSRGAVGSRFRVRYALAPMVQGIPQAPFRRPSVRPKKP